MATAMRTRTATMMTIGIQLVRSQRLRPGGRMVRFLAVVEEAVLGCRVALAAAWGRRVARARLVLRLGGWERFADKDHLQTPEYGDCRRRQGGWQGQATQGGTACLAGRGGLQSLVAWLLGVPLGGRDERVAGRD